MKLVITSTFNLPPLEYFTEELGWNCNSIEEIAKEVAAWNEKDIIELLGYGDYSWDIKGLTNPD